VFVKLFQLVLRDYQLAGMLVSLAAAVGATLLTWRIALHFTGRGLALLAALAVALNPLFIRLSLMTLSESLYTFFVLLGLLMFIKERWFPFGLAMGAAAITRPEAIAIVGLLGLTRLKHPRQLAVIAAGFLVVYAANNVRLSTSLGRVVILPKSEFIGSSTHYWKLREASIDYEGRDKTEAQMAEEGEESGALKDYGQRLPGEIMVVIRHVFPVILLLSLYALRRRKYWFMAAALVSFFVIPLATVRSIDRYILPYIPVIIMLAVFAVADIRNHTVRMAAVGLIVASILVLPVYNSATLLEPEEDNVVALKELGLEFRGDVKPGDKVADRKPYFAFYSGADYVEIPVAPYEESMEYLASEQRVRFMVLHQQVIHTMRPAFRTLMYSKAVINGELRFRQVFYDSRGVMLFERVLDEDPLQWQRLTPPGGSDVAPAWSPDGRYIAFRSQTSDGAGGIYAIELGATTPKKVAGVRPTDDPLSWSPDGKRIVYSDGTREDTDIFAVDVASGRIEPVVQRPGFQVSPSWAPSGAEIVFSSTHGGQADLWAVDLETGKLKQITNDGGNTRPAVSPSGGKVAWIKRDTGVMTFDIETGQSNFIQAPRRVRFPPTWSPDEQYLAVTASDWGSPDVYLMKADGTNTLLLTKRWKQEGMPAWSPDGRRIALVSNTGEKSFSIWVVDGLRPYLHRLETRQPLQVFDPSAVP
jgi:TolB protein